MDDATTLLRTYAEEGSQAAFTELVQCHLDLVYSAALRRVGGDAHRAAEVAQVVFTKLARDARRLARHTVLTAWLYTATRNAAIDLMRVEHRRQAREQEASTMQTLMAATPDTDWARLRPVLDGALDELPENDRTAVLLRFFEKQPFAEIGSTLQISEDAARMRVERALEKLRGLLGKRDITSTSAALATVLANQAVATAPAGLAASIAGTALGGLAAGGGMLAATIGFMTATKMTAVMGVAALLAIGAAVHQSTQAQATDTALTEANRETAALQTRLAGLTAEVAAAENAQVERAKAVAKSAVAANAASSASAAAEKARQEKALQQFLAGHPEMRSLQLESSRLNYEASTGRFLKSVGLTSAQAEKVVGWQMQNAAAVLAYRERGAEMKPTGWFFSQLRAEFGDAVADAYEAPAKFVVEGLANKLYYAEPALTREQGERLREIIADAVLTKTRHQSLTSAQVDWDRVLPAAEPILTAQQMQGLHGLAASGRLRAQLAAVQVPSTPAKK